MTIPHPTNLPPSFPVVAGTRLTVITTNEGEVRAALSALEKNKAVGPDGVSPRWQVILAPQKTKLLVMSTSEHDIRPTLNGAQLTSQPELQILEFTFDSKLT
ncbi:hypothetical protein E2C01_054338 [Portunus trituberculatus]|uniref:Uncharacterized protein n=1 Tax=Portunus trituberculatus TaxID=210409 RepID=A0A5B7GSX4_PORTR|nr:hypothetical protein [Portunus trituberculatus]